MLPIYVLLTLPINAFIFDDYAVESYPCASRIVHEWVFALVGLRQFSLRQHINLLDAIISGYCRHIRIFPCEAQKDLHCDHECNCRGNFDESTITAEMSCTLQPGLFILIHGGREITAELPICSYPQCHIGHNQRRRYFPKRQTNPVFWQVSSKGFQIQGFNGSLALTRYCGPPTMQGHNHTAGLRQIWQFFCVLHCLTAGIRIPAEVYIWLQIPQRYIVVHKPV